MDAERKTTAILLVSLQRPVAVPEKGPELRENARLQCSSRLGYICETYGGILKCFNPETPCVYCDSYTYVCSDHYTNYRLISSYQIHHPEGESCKYCIGGMYICCDCLKSGRGVPQCVPCNQYICPRCADHVCVQYQN
jgi:hypothetical protein